MRESWNRRRRYVRSSSTEVRWRNSCFRPPDPMKQLHPLPRDRSLRRGRRLYPHQFPHQFPHRFPHQFPHRFPHRRVRRWRDFRGAFRSRVRVVSIAVDPGGINEGQMGGSRSRWATDTIGCVFRRSIVERWIPAG